jgi:hypothetical protein
MNGQPTGGTVRLPGLDGSNPLGFLAALGVLRIADHVARSQHRPSPRLGWVEAGYWQAVIQGENDLDLDFLVAAILEDKASWADDPAMLLAYDATGENLVDPRQGNGNAVRDLRPRPGAMRLFLDRLAGRAEGTDRGHAGLTALRRSLDTVGFYGSEVVQDNKGNTKPFALHFSAGQQRFLKAIAQLQEGVCEADLREALVGPWRGASKLPSMSWDATVARIYALRASDPSAEKRGSNAGADWLAFVGLGLLMAAPHRGVLRTTGVRGGWKDAEFTWPVWTPLLTARVVRSVLAIEDLHVMPHMERACRGIGGVFSSRVTRSDQGGYGGFTPAQVL